ncbi:hypothetical protein GALMADRAFT_243958 [Galerina marginata CBS 339.88]|uniref:MYND-type domain-containing protein n=1 Tax=Galerina marginata (strain CBS 339.88) TaxID=685588 RepID=A0A067TF80_GALM3|nr:hypothetical protein GALMADRAFT_243958 [Galerina marginata CBS 339.88]
MNKSNMTRTEMLKKRMGQLAKLHDTGEGRPLEELMKSKEVLRGQESLRLRRFCTSNCMEPQRDLDTLGKLLLTGNQDAVFLDYTARLAEKSKTMELEAAIEAVAQEYASMRWGPTEAPIFNLLGLFMQIVPSRRTNYLGFSEFLIGTRVPVDGKDLSGTAALSHTFSTKPSFDLEYAQMLYDAGGDVNTRNRYGATVAHEIVQVYDPSDPEVVRKSTKALEWFLSHGGSLDIADGDGMTPRFMCERMGSVLIGLKRLVEKEDERRRQNGDLTCSLCGRDEGKLLSCGRCKKAKYCDPGSRACQKLDWPRHKKGCKA